VKAMPLLSFEQVKGRVAEHLKTAMGTDEFDITSAKLEEIQRIWTVRVEFKKPKAMFSDTASMIVDATTGEVREFRKDM
jgi:hypothetical protein